MERTQEEVKEILSEIRKDIIMAVNRGDSIAYAHYVQELYIGAAKLEDEEDRKELGIFVMLIEKTFRQIKGAN